MAYQTLDAAKILDTLRRLESRVAERFAGSGLSAVVHTLVALAETTEENAKSIAARNPLFRLAIAVVLLSGLAAIVFLYQVLWPLMRTGELQTFEVLQGVEAAINILVIVGAAIFFLVTVEDRFKRRRTMRALHEIRSIAHVIDMHQLTKDPSVVLHEPVPTESSPTRTLTRFELTRYLDYCSEMLSLCGKLAALYAQSLPDPVVIGAVNDIEQVTADLSRKIWQKIAILESYNAAERLAVSG